MTLLAGIFGYPIGHSISPSMHNAAFRYSGIDAVYEAWETPPNALSEGIQRLRRDECLGANVTVPHKQAVIEYLDDVDDIASRIGAVNTIVNSGSRLTGFNTDAVGFINSLKQEAGLDPNGLDVVLLGAGGAARAAAYALEMEGASRLTIANRTSERAASLADEMRRTGVEVTAFGMDDPRILSRCKHADLIVNSTSVGMLRGPAESKSPIPARAITSESVVYDMVYNPPNTPLLMDAEKAGARRVGGLPMLVYQGAAAWTLWTGQAAPVGAMFAAAKDALGL